MNAIDVFVLGLRFLAGIGVIGLWVLVICAAIAIGNRRLKKSGLLKDVSEKDTSKKETLIF